MKNWTRFKVNHKMYQTFGNAFQNVFFIPDKFVLSALNFPLKVSYQFQEHCFEQKRPKMPV
jgi:hypothetical protein